VILWTANRDWFEGEAQGQLCRRDATALVILLEG